MQYACYDSPFGSVQIGCEDGFIVSVRRAAGTEHCPSPLSDLAAKQLREYFERKRQVFDLPLKPRGTAFQRAVWNALLEIPYGQTRSYGDIAAAVGNPKAARAVGMACNKNPIWIIIPCHRVVGSNRKLTGYAGGLEMKRALLEQEQG